VVNYRSFVGKHSELVDLQWDESQRTKLLRILPPANVFCRYGSKLLAAASNSHKRAHNGIIYITIGCWNSFGKNTDGRTAQSQTTQYISGFLIKVSNLGCAWAISRRNNGDNLRDELATVENSNSNIMMTVFFSANSRISYTIFVENTLYRTYYRQMSTHNIAICCRSTFWPIIHVPSRCITVIGAIWGRLRCAQHPQMCLKWIYIKIRITRYV
jgi:hypothetical protein